jgi:K+-sensing histidine kinase KdpD
MFIETLRNQEFRPNLVPLSIKECLQKTLQEPYLQTEEIKKRLVLELEDDFVVPLSPSLFKHVIYNLVKNAYWHGGATQIKLITNSQHQTLTV